MHSHQLRNLPQYSPLCPCSATHIRPVAARSHQCVCHVPHLLSLLQQTKRMWVWTDSYLHIAATAIIGYQLWSTGVVYFDSLLTHGLGLLMLQQITCKTCCCDTLLWLGMKQCLCCNNQPWPDGGSPSCCTHCRVETVAWKLKHSKIVDRDRNTNHWTKCNINVRNVVLNR